MFRYIAILILIFSFNKAVYATDIQLNFPVVCKYGFTCWILNYFDANAHENIAEDYTCGGRTYDGHAGIDIAIKDLSVADEGIFVIAAADGEVTSINNAVVDQIASQNNPVQSACGNGVIINHSKGWRTQYCHMKQNSVLVKPGDIVQSGQILGQIGLSGATSWPHLGFFVSRNGKYFDPYSGRIALEGCGLSGDGLWLLPDTIKYQPFSVFNLGFSVGPPDENAIILGSDMPLALLPANTPSLHFWVSVFGLQENDVLTLKILGPDEEEIAFKRIPISQAQSKGFYSISHAIGSGYWDAGWYRGVVRLERGAGSSKDITEWERLIQIAE